MIVDDGDDEDGDDDVDDDDDGMGWPYSSMCSLE